MGNDQYITTDSINEYLESKSWEHLIPLNASFELTYRCNERCIHCYVESPFDDKELSTQEVKRVLDELAELQTLQITFTGGEIFVRKDIKEILQYARNLKYNINISTNGILIDERMADFLKEKIKPWEIGISLYGSTPAIHDAVTQVKGSFEKTVKAIKILRERNIRTKAKIVIMSINYDDYKNIKKLTEELGVKHLIDFNITPKTTGDLSPLDLRISDERIQEFIFNEAIGLEIYTMDKERYEKETKLKLDGYLCKAGNNFINITPYGEVTPCIQWYYPVGNIRNNSLHDIWYNSEKLNYIRKLKIRDIEKCNKCEYLAYCNRCPGVALLIDGDSFGISTLSCRYVDNIKAVIEKKYKKNLIPT